MLEVNTHVLRCRLAVLVGQRCAEVIVLDICGGTACTLVRDDGIEHNFDGLHGGRECCCVPVVVNLVPTGRASHTILQFAVLHLDAASGVVVRGFTSLGHIAKVYEAASVRVKQANDFFCTGALPFLLVRSVDCVVIHQFASLLIQVYRSIGVMPGGPPQL